MIWVVWRQHRKQALIETGVVGVAALLLLLTGYQMLHFFKSSGLSQCLATAGADCGDLRDTFSNHYNGYQFMIPLFLAAPVLFGMFFGAPLITREIENGTHRLAWTQGVTRKRWISTHTAMIAGFALAGSVALAGLITWWSRPLVASSASRFEPGIFDLRGIVPVAYTIFAVMLGVAIGALVKKTLPALGLTLVSFATVRTLILLFVRQHFIPAKTLSFAFNGGGPRAQGVADWVIRENTVDRLGHIVQRGGGLNFEYLSSRCPGLPLPSPVPRAGGVIKPGIDAVQSCIDRLGLHTSIAYQPANRFWTFQWIEFGIYIALAALLAWFVIRRVRRIA